MSVAASVEEFCVHQPYYGKEGVQEWSSWYFSSISTLI